MFESPLETLFKLFQHDSVQDYYTEFVALANCTNIDPLEALMDCFISGLHQYIRGMWGLSVLPHCYRLLYLLDLMNIVIHPFQRPQDYNSLDRSNLLFL